MIRHTEFDKTINDVEMRVVAAVYVEDDEFDEFTVYIGDTIVTEVLDQSIIDDLKKEAIENVSDEAIAADKADFDLKGE
ncbi:MAG: hypothetical protein IJV75_00040 [Alphaproteobacteria bacterium]|nr:hypothetical protein [Alphaproteobacteria bacterium]